MPRHTSSTEVNQAVTSAMAVKTCYPPPSNFKIQALLNINNFKQLNPDTQMTTSRLWSEFALPWLGNSLRAWLSVPLCKLIQILRIPLLFKSIWELRLMKLSGKGIWLRILILRSGIILLLIMCMGLMLRSSMCMKIQRGLLLCHHLKVIMLLS